MLLKKLWIERNCMNLWSTYNPSPSRSSEGIQLNCSKFLDLVKDRKNKKNNLKNLTINFWYTKTKESTRIRRRLLSEQSWIMKIKIWFIKSKEYNKKKAKGEDTYRNFLKDSIVRVFNFIIFIEKKHIGFNSSRNY